MSNDNWETPDWIKLMFAGWHDPLPINTVGLRSDDGGDWNYEKIFVNPPYSDPEKWVKKAIEAHRRGSKVALLLKVDTSTKLYARLVQENGHILLINERLHFSNNRAPAPFPSMLVILGD